MKSLESLFPQLDKLTSRQRSIAQYVLSAPEETAYLSLKELSRRAGVSEVSVLRMCRSLGLENYVELKQLLRDYNSERIRMVSPPVFLSGQTGRELEDPETVLARVCEDDMQNMRSMMNGLDREQLFACAGKLLKADQVVVLAHDASFLFAEYLSSRLNFLRIQCSSVKIGDSDTLQSALARLGQKDWVVFLSFPPYHQPIRNLVHYCRFRGVPMLAITDGPESPVAEPGVSVFFCRTAARYYYNSHCATIAFINLLASCISYLMGSRFEDILDQERQVGDLLLTSAEEENGGEKSPGGFLGGE